MKASDLMIGDWVSYKDKMPCRITAICKDCAVVDNDTTQDWDIDYEDLRPIPLTAEVLEKNGFVFANGHYWLKDDDDMMLVVVAYGLFLLNGYSNMDLRHVHELQHALRLCGIDKDIEL